jgi:hypothetical protein
MRTQEVPWWTLKQHITAYAITLQTQLATCATMMQGLLNAAVNRGSVHLCGFSKPHFITQDAAPVLEAVLHHPLEAFHLVVSQHPAVVEHR